MDHTKDIWIPDLVYVEGRFRSEMAIVTSDEQTPQVVSVDEIPRACSNGMVLLNNKAVLPGLVNAHSHAFQRVIRGRTEHRSQHSSDSFWTWREQMYAAANKLTAEDIYDASRMAFLEMALSGITAVGEFHYIHHSPTGPYDDPNLLSKGVIQAATDVGIRITLLRVAFERAGFNKDPDPLQTRFIEESETYLKNVESLLSERSDMVHVGVAPHSVRAVTLNYLKSVGEFATQHQLPIHMHVAEQPAEVSACIEEYGRSPVALLDTEGLLNDRFSAVHAIHVTPKAVGSFARTGAMVCACPTTERNLGDGVVPVNLYWEDGVAVSLGSDSHTQIDLLEDARELEYHLRLQRTQRNVLAPEDDHHRAALAQRLLECATTNGARSIGGSSNDFFTLDLDDPTLAGSTEEDLLPNIVFSSTRAAVRDVVVNGKQIVSDGVHADQQEIVEKFKALQRRLWN